jgi:hypothetical protein
MQGLYEFPSAIICGVTVSAAFNLPVSGASNKVRASSIA